jgi:hypothetical protein
MIIQKIFIIAVDILLNTLHNYFTLYYSLDYYVEFRIVKKAPIVNAVATTVNNILV